MQQHQQQLRAQRQATTNSSSGINRLGQTNNAFNGPSQTPYTNQTNQNTASAIPNQTQQIKLHQPLLNAPVAVCSKELMPLSTTNSSDLDVSEEDLKDLFSQKDLATTLAEDLLKHFGSDDIEIKEEPDTNTLSSGPFSPSNIDASKDVKEESKERLKSPTTESVLTVKNELHWDLDTLHPSDKKSDTEYNITMDARAILELCKYD